MDITEALALLQEATPESITAQLLQVNIAIQKADEQEIVAIYHTLEGVVGAMLQNTNPKASAAITQINQLKRSAISRMVALIGGAAGLYAKAQYQTFCSAVGYDRNLDNALKSQS